MTVRLVASDLDGTLFGPDHFPEPRTVAAVNAVVDAGIAVVAVTGRSHFGGFELARSTGAKLDWFIGSNGGHRVNGTTGELEERLLFEASVLRDLFAELPARIGHVGFAREHASTFYFDERFLELQPMSLDGGRRKSGAPPEQFDDVGKWFITHPEVHTHDLVELVKPHVPDEFHVTTSGVTFVEVTPGGADKGSAVARLCDELGISAEEVIAFGDNHNDLTMLEWAGRGVAMGNAQPEVKAVADEITSTNADFGVAEILENLI